MTEVHVQQGHRKQVLEMFADHHDNSVMTTMLAPILDVSDFELQLRYYIHFRSNTLGKSMNPLIQL